MPEDGLLGRSSAKEMNSTSYLGGDKGISDQRAWKPRLEVWGSAWVVGIGIKVVFRVLMLRALSFTLSQLGLRQTRSLVLQLS